VSATPESQNRLQQRSGKQIVTLTGADFQFVEKVAMVSKGDKYASPSAVPFSLPRGRGQGPQNSLEVQVDTTSLPAADYSLLLYQPGGNTQTIDVKVLQEPPTIDHLPLILNESDKLKMLLLEGNGLDRITALEADGLRFEFDNSESSAKRRSIRVHQERDLKDGSALDLRMSLEGYAKPVVLAGAIQIKGRRPVIRDVNASLPSDLQTALHPGELPAGTQIGIMLNVTGAGTEPSVKLACKNVNVASVDVKAGSEKDGVKLNAMQANTLFLSLNPGVWPDGCQLTAVLRNRDAGPSDGRDLGRVVRLPHIDSFQLTDEAAGDGNYIGVLSGRDLELIAKSGWNATSGYDVLGLPTPISGEGNKQSLKVRVSWPSPSPRSRLFIWLRGEEEGRATTVRY
jgi:hypothetical protein